MDLDPADERNRVLVSYQGSGLFGIWDPRLQTTLVLNISISEFQAGLASQIAICWNSSTNLLYQVQYRSSLITGDWTNLDGTIIGQSDTTCTNDSIGPGQMQKFYRVILLP
jgi:hypothetical protein